MMYIYIYITNLSQRIVKVFDLIWGEIYLIWGHHVIPLDPISFDLNLGPLCYHFRSN